MRRKEMCRKKTYMVYNHNFCRPKHASCCHHYFVVQHHLLWMMVLNSVEILYLTIGEKWQCKDWFFKAVLFCLTVNCRLQSFNNIVTERQLYTAGMPCLRKLYLFVFVHNS